MYWPDGVIEGQAMRDLKTLPKLIGVSDSRSANTAEEVLRTVGTKIIMVSKLETAGTIKMVDNYSRYVFIDLANYTQRLKLLRMTFSTPHWV